MGGMPMSSPLKLAIVVGLWLVPLAGCFNVQSSKGGAETKAYRGRHAKPADIAVPEGYRIEAIATGLNFPTGVAIDDAGVPHVVEAGYCYGEVITTPRLIRVEDQGKLST